MVRPDKVKDVVANLKTYDDELLYDVLQKNLGDFDIFVKHVLEYLARRESG